MGERLIIRSPRISLSTDGRSWQDLLLEPAPAEPPPAEVVIVVHRQAAVLRSERIPPGCWLPADTFGGPYRALVLDINAPCPDCGLHMVPQRILLNRCDLPDSQGRPVFWDGRVLSGAEEPAHEGNPEEPES
jgi:hypothetical protein